MTKSAIAPAGEMEFARLPALGGRFARYALEADPTEPAIRAEASGSAVR